MTKDGIEIHFDEKRGYLELACEPDAFAAYREIARKHLEDLPEIPIEKVVEIHITDTATIVARRDAPKRSFGGIILTACIGAILALAAIGLVSIVFVIIK